MERYLKDEKKAGFESKSNVKLYNMHLMLEDKDRCVNSALATSRPETTYPRRRALMLTMSHFAPL